MERPETVRAARAYAPFAGAMVLAWVAVAVSSSVVWWQYAVSAGLLLVTWLLAGMRMRRHPRALPATADALLFLAAVAVLRNASRGMTSGTGTLALIPVFYTALYGTNRRSLLVVLAGVTVFYLAPIIFIGAPAYPVSQYRAALLFLTMASIIGVATQGLVATVSAQAREARNRERMLEQLTKVVHGLFDSPQVRADVCEAARSISDASAAVIFEPDDRGDELGCTAMAGIAATSPAISSAGPESAAGRAFRSGRPILVSDHVREQAVSVELWEAAGRPDAALYQPLLNDGAPLGVLAIGWSGEVVASDPRVTVAALLAHEAAAVISRSDAMTHLNLEAQTDPLTGLPNRRAWDNHLRLALNDERQVALAILDFDYFKHFNDAHGHPAGDRLLKETAAAWRDRLRTGDVLARLGGEEFGLLLRDCDTSTATEVIGRLREDIPQQQTCSAGVAIREAGESIDALVVRADEALYKAKALGRDRVRVSGRGPSTVRDAALLAPILVPQD